MGCAFGGRLTVLKEGPNTGREFFACSKPRSESCGFFQWVDNDREGGEPFPVTLDTCKWLWSCVFGATFC